jgi:hypothetical protein
LESHFKTNSQTVRRGAQPKMARATRRVIGNPREKGNLGGNYEAEPGRLTRLFTLHDASLRAHMDAAVHNVNLKSFPSIRRREGGVQASSAFFVQ